MLRRNASKRYDALLERIEFIHERAASASKEQSNRVLLETRWLTGKHLVEVEQDGKLRAAYGDRLLERLAEDLRERHGRGWSARSLRAMRRFHSMYRVEALRPALGWSH